MVKPYRPKIFYVYEHWRPDTDVCFYVGKGKGKRAWGKRNNNKFYKNVVAKLARKGLGIEVRIVQGRLTEPQAFSLEIDRIAFWRASGVKLANVTDGGHGPSGKVWTKAQLKRLGLAISKSRQGMKFAPGHCANLSLMKIGRKRKPFTAKTIRKMKRAAANRRNTRPGTWTPTRVDELKSLHSLGLSTKEISRRMRLSRQTINGKLSRLRLKINPQRVFAE